MHADVFIAGFGGLVENTAGFVGLGATVVNDVLEGNTTVTNDNLYIGKDTIVSGRNTAIGMIPESNLDLGVSASQMKYDLDRFTGQKSGGAVPVLSKSPLGLISPVFALHPQFLLQAAFGDWW